MFSGSNPELPKKEKMNISQEVLDNLVSYSHSIFRDYPFYWDKITVSFLKKGFLKKKKIVDKKILFKRLNSNYYNKQGEVNPEAENLKQLLRKYLSGDKQENMLKALALEYVNGTDDFSLGVLHAIEEIKRRANA